MKEPDYLKERLEDQINWYDTKSTSNQKKYKILRNSEIILAALVPLCSGYISVYPFFSYVVGILGVLITVIAGFLGLNKYHENWIEYRSICETLRHEKYMYIAGAGVYSGDNSFQQLVERIESIISHENLNWAQFNKSNLKSNNGGKENGKEKDIH